MWREEGCQYSPIPHHCWLSVAIYGLSSLWILEPCISGQIDLNQFPPFVNIHLIPALLLTPSPPCPLHSYLVQIVPISCATHQCLPSSFPDQLKSHFFHMINLKGTLFSTLLLPLRSAAWRWKEYGPLHMIRIWVPFIACCARLLAAIQVYSNRSVNSFLAPRYLFSLDTAQKWA